VTLIQRLRRDPWLMVAVFLGVVLLLLVVVPQLWIVRSSLLARDGESVTLENFLRYLTAARYRTALVNSVLLAMVTTILAMLVAVPLAFFHARYRLPGRDLVLTLATLATASPPFLGAYAWIMLLGYNGILSPVLRDMGLPWHSIVGFHGVVWVGVWGAVGLVFLFAHDAFASLDGDLEEAAEAAGAKRWRAHLDIALPLALPGLLTAAYLVLTGVLADFGTPRIIGGPVSVLPVLLYHEFLSEGGVNPRMASAGSLLSVGLATAVLLLQRLVLAGRSYVMSGTRRVSPRVLPRWATVVLTGVTALFFLMVFVPHLVIAFSSFLSWRADIPGLPFTLDNYRALATRSTAPVLVSYALSAISTLVAVVVGTLLAYVAVRRTYRYLSPSLQALTMIPYLIPGTVLAIGLIVVFNREPMRLTGTWMILALAYFIRKVPYATKSAEASLYQVPENLEEAALSVGATPAQALRDVTSRLILPGLVSGATLTFLMTLTELSSTLMLYGAATTTMSIVIYQAAMGMGGQFGLAASTAVAMMVSVYLPLYLVRKRFPSAGVAA
jgi:iron(III) transport system permease protein